MFTNPCKVLTFFLTWAGFFGFITSQLTLYFNDRDWVIALVKNPSTICGRSVGDEVSRRRGRSTQELDDISGTGAISLVSPKHARDKRSLIAYKCQEHGARRGFFLRLLA